MSIIAAPRGIQIKIISNKEIEEAAKKSSQVSINIRDSLEAKYKNNPSYIYYGSSIKLPKVTNVISTGAIGIDMITAKASNGRWGLPFSRFVYLYGREKSGKTTIVLSIIREIQRLGGVAFMVESEHSLDVGYAKSLGVDMGQVLFSQPSSLEDACDVIMTSCSIVEKFRKKDKDFNSPVFIVVDSISAFPTQSEIDNDFSKKPVGGHARVISQMCRVLTEPISKLNILILFVAQQRSKIGVVYGDNTTFIGGDALKYHASVGYRVSRVGWIKGSNDSKVGIRSKVMVVHNKCRPPMEDAEIDIIWGKGIDSIVSLYDTMTDKKLIKKKGSWNNYIDRHGKERSWQGMEEFVEITKDQLELNKMIELVYGS